MKVAARGITAAATVLAATLVPLHVDVESAPDAAAIAVRANAACATTVGWFCQYGPWPMLCASDQDPCTGLPMLGACIYWHPS